MQNWDSVGSIGLFCIYVLALITSLSGNVSWVRV